MNNKEIEKVIEEAWIKKDQIDKNSDQKIIDIIKKKEKTHENKIV